MILPVMKVGFLGMGAMGAPMAANLLKAGHEVAVWNRTASRCEPLRSAGARVASSPSDAAREADVVLSIVTSAPQVRAVSAQAFETMRRGSTYIDMSTIDPASSREVAAAAQAKGIRFLDAPVSGGTGGAKAGTLTIMVGGDAAVLEDVRPVLEALGKSIYHVGPVGAGETVKLCNNLIYVVQMVAVSEAFAMARKSGVDLKQLFEIVKRSTGNCYALETRAPEAGVIPESPASNGWALGYSTDLVYKDLGLILSFAQQAGVPAFSAAVCQHLYGLAASAGWGQKDFSAVSQVINAMAG